MSDEIGTPSETQAYDSAGVQHIEDKQLYVGSTVNGAFERIEDPKADPKVEPEIQLKNGWRNGNIKIGTGAPTASTSGHDWDIYLDVPAGTGWVAVTAVYLKRP